MACAPQPQFLEDQLTLNEPGWQIIPTTLLCALLDCGFSDLAMALRVCKAYLCCKHCQSLSLNVKWRIYVCIFRPLKSECSRLSKSNKSHSVFICHVVLIYMKFLSNQISRFFLSNHRGAEITEKKKSAWRTLCRPRAQCG